jgi:hypothetical protein
MFPDKEVEGTILGVENGLLFMKSSLQENDNCTNAVKLRNIAEYLNKSRCK